MKPSDERRNRDSALSDCAVTSTPAMRTSPFVGRSSVPSTLSRVDLPEPDAPTRTAKSRRYSVRLTSTRALSLTPSDSYTLSTPVRLAMICGSIDPLSVSCGASDVPGSARETPEAFCRIRKIPPSATEVPDDGGDNPAREGNRSPHHVDPVKPERLFIEGEDQLRPRLERSVDRRP